MFICLEIKKVVVSLQKQNIINMSFAILYNRQFIKVDDNHVIPFILQGDNNVYECINDRRRARDWCNSYAHTNGMNIIANNNELLQNIDEYRLKTIERCEDDTKKYGEGWEYNDKHWGYHVAVAMYGKGTRNTTFSQYKAFYKNAIKNAMTIEELKANGVSICLYVYRWKDTDITDKGLEIKPDVWFSSTEQLVNTIKEYREYYGSKFNIFLKQSGMQGFMDKKVNLNKINKINRNNDKVTVTVNEYYVLAYGENFSFIKNTRTGFHYSYNLTGGKSFINEKEATNFLNKMKNRDKFSVKKVVGEKKFLTFVKTKQHD